MGFIYLLISPSGKGYIGQTIRPPKKRWQDHKDNARCSIGKKNYKIGCPALAKAIIKYGFETFKKIILIEVETQRFLDYYEIYYIRKYNTLTPNGYNISPGGGGNGMTPERLKIKEKKAALKLKEKLEKAKNRKHALIVPKPNDTDKLPPHLMWFETKYKGKITGCGYRIRRHPKCSDKSFYVNLYGSKENALKAALEFYKSLTNSNIKPILKDPIKLKQSEGLPLYMSYYAIKDRKTGKITSEIYRIRRHQKCKFISFSTSKYGTLDATKKAALEYYNKLSK
jgi:group I intron endonuclease